MNKSLKIGRAYKNGEHAERARLRPLLKRALAELEALYQEYDTHVDADIIADLRRELGKE